MTVPNVPARFKQSEIQKLIRAAAAESKDGRWWCVRVAPDMSMYIEPHAGPVTPKPPPDEEEEFVF